MDDLEFVQQCAKGDKQAWDDFVDRYSKLIYSYIHSVLKLQGFLATEQNVNDIFQEVFLLLTQDNFRKLKTFQARNGSSLASWLRQVVINCSLTFLRRYKPVVSLDEDNDEGSSFQDLLFDASPAVRDVLSNKERLGQLAECVEKLEPGDKYLLELHINQGLELGQVQNHLKVSRGALDMRKKRIVERLRECFKTKNFMLDF
ncbi:MAG: sigma-70 family RNA polymerase sigma factor [Candidatus Omnitrophota bacterium]